MVNTSSRIMLHAWNQNGEALLGPTLNNYQAVYQYSDDWGAYVPAIPNRWTITGYDPRVGLDPIREVCARKHYNRVESVATLVSK